MLKQLIVSMALAGAVNLGHAQQSLGDMVEQEGLGWIAGTWEGEDDNGGRVTLVYAWELDKNLVTTHVKTEWMESKGMTMMCHKTGEIRYVAADNRGSSATGTWNLTDGHPTLKVEYSSPDGETNKGAYVHKKIDANAIEVVVYMGQSAEYLSGTPAMTIKFKRKQ